VPTVFTKGIIAWGDDEYLRKLDVDIPVYYYGFKETDDIYAKNIQISLECCDFHIVGIRIDHKIRL
jgi:UDP-N-acetylmuramate--alanine ligase